MATSSGTGAAVLPPNVVRSRKLAGLALVLWLISLGLPSYSYSAQMDYGLGILVMGLTMGWAVKGGWAAYANLPLLYAIVIFLRRAETTPTTTPIGAAVLGLGGMAFFTAAPVFGAGHPNMVQLTSWGLGAAVWVLAILTVCLAQTARLGWTDAMLERVLLAVGLLTTVIMASRGALALGF